MRRPGLTAELRARARAAGFDALGIAEAGRLEEDGAALRDWLGQGRQAEMSWMARDPERRIDPRRLMPGCRSVVTLASSYWPGGPSRERRPGAGRVARYAWGRDYHRVLGGRLTKLAGWLESVTGHPARAFVDSAPLLERGWARRAGIGWIGKNANLLNRELGSWLLLGEILSAAELDPDPGPSEEFCGTCTACVEACPTAAIVADGVVDASLCISYWTIEHRGPVPPSYRRGLGDWIFGCDVCQEVCPWNRRFARPVPEQRFVRRTELEALDAEEILELDETAFRARYSGTALMRARWDGMRRNACVVLGNLRHAPALPGLGRSLSDPDETIRSHAAWALGRIGGREAGDLLERARSLERSGDVLREIERALEECRSR